MTDRTDVLVVGAGPTGLALAAQLAAFGQRHRIIDRGLDRVHESRALAIQPRTLELLAGLGVTDDLVAAGRPAVHLRLHARGRAVQVPLFGVAGADTSYPYLLFLSQAETERVLVDHLTTAGIGVERGVELVALDRVDDGMVATLRHRDGRDEKLHAAYVVGCDGAHSTAREQAGIPFEGGSYPQTFVLADIEADGIEPGSVHAYLSGAGMMFFFPLGVPATWRLLAMRPPTDPTPAGAPVDLAEVQGIVDRGADAAIRLRDPVWMTNFRLHHRGARAYRSGRVFLAGDAAHIHSPAGGQGMNTGIQDSVNLAWKLAQALHGTAGTDLLDTYDGERAPVGAAVVRFTDRAFSVATSTNPVVRLARTWVAPALIPLLLRPGAVRRYAFRTVTQLAIRYRDSPLSVDGPSSPRHGPRAGDRLPDAPIVHNGQKTTLHELTRAPGWHLLLCGPREAWSGPLTTAAPLSGVHGLAGSTGAAGTALHRLGVTGRDAAHYLIRPDGYVGYRAGGTDLTGLNAYLRRWLG